MVILFEFNIIIKAIYLYALFALVAATLNKYVKNQIQIIYSLLGGIILATLTLFDVIHSSEMFLSVLVIVLISIVLFKPKRFRKILLIIFVSLAYTLLKWGFSYLLQIVLFRFYKNITIKALVDYYLLDLVLSVIISIIIYIGFRIVYQKKLILDFVYDTQIIIGDKVITCKMLLDSGNSLIDDKTGLPVVVVSKLSIEEKLGDGINLNNLRQLGYQTLGGYCSNLFIIKPDEICIIKNGKIKKIDAVIGVVEKKFKLYDGLLHMQTV